MLEIIVGNITSVLAMLSDSFSGTRKTNRSTLLFQCVSQVFYAAGAILLKGYSAAVQNIVAVARNLFAAGGKKNKIIEWVLILAAVVLGVLFNNRGVIGLLPVAANLMYSVSIFRFRENERALKITFVINMILFCVFNCVILNFVGAAGNIVTAVTTSVYLIKTRKK